MKKNYRKGIMKVYETSDEVTKFKTESMEEISRLPFFSTSKEGADNIASSQNDGVENSQNDQ